MNICACVCAFYKSIAAYENAKSVEQVGTWNILVSVWSLQIIWIYQPLLSKLWLHTVKQFKWRVKGRLHLLNNNLKTTSYTQWSLHGTGNLELLFRYAGYKKSPEEMAVVSERLNQTTNPRSVRVSVCLSSHKSFSGLGIWVLQSLKVLVLKNTILTQNIEILRIMFYI